MIAYYGLWAAIIIPYLAFTDRHTLEFKKNYAIYIWICLSLLIGLRATSVGADTIQYEYRYKIVEELIKPGATERGYSLFSYYIKEMGFSYHAFLFIVACLQAGGVIFFYATYSPNIAFSALIFSTIGLLPMYMSGIRQAFAITICLQAFLWIDKPEGFLPLLFSLFLISIASTFNVSSIASALAVLLILSTIRLSRQTLFILVAFSAAALVYRKPLVSIIHRFLPAKYMSFDMNENYRINPLLIIISILIPVYCLSFDTLIENDGKYSKEKTWLYLFSCLNILFTILAQNSMYFSRMSFYFVHVNSILIPDTISRQSVDEEAKIMYLILGIICVLYFIISIPGGTLKIDNYKFLWQ